MKRNLAGPDKKWGWIGLSVALALGGPAVRAAEVGNMARQEIALAPTAVLNDIPLHPRAQNVVPVAPSQSELREMLRPFGSAGTAAIRGVRAIVFRVPGPITVAEIMRWYATPETRATPRPAEAVSGPRVGEPAGRTGIRPLAGERGYLVVLVTPWPGRPQDARVTVTRVEGSPGVVKLLDEVATIVDRSVAGVRLGGRHADVTAFAYPGSAVVRDIVLPAADVPQLLRQIQAGTAPAAVKAMYAAILQGAESISVTSYSRPAVIAPADFFRFYQDAAVRLAWGEVMRDQTNPERPMIVYSLGDGLGIAMVRSEVTSVTHPVTRRMVPGTAVTLLIVTGRVDLKAVRDARP